MRRLRCNETTHDFGVDTSPLWVAATASTHQLARDLGYKSIRQMMEQTEIVPLPSGLFIHLTTDSDGYWVAWSDRPFYDIQRFESRESALEEIRTTVNPLFAQS